MAMHSNWNPWHGCKKCSEGCEHCYVYYLDAMRGKDGADVYKTKTGFAYPLARDRKGHYKVPDVLVQAALQRLLCLRRM